MHRVKPEVGEQQRVDGGISLACQICLLYASDAVGCRLGIEPVVAGKVVEPRMVESAMVENHVHNHLDTAAVAF